MEYAVEIIRTYLTTKTTELKNLEDDKKPVSQKLRLQIEDLKRALSMLTE